MLVLYKKVKLFLSSKLKPKIDMLTAHCKKLLNIITIKYSVWRVNHTRPFTKLNYNAHLTYLLLAIIFFVPTFCFVFTTLQLFGIEYNCIEVLNLFYEFFTNILKFLENNINNFNNQETTMSFKNESSTPNNAMLEADLTNNSKVDKGVDEVKELNLKSKDTNTTTNSTTSDDTKKSNPLACLNNKYVIVTFIGGLAIVGLWLINPDLPVTCFRGLKNLFWGNNGNQGNIPDQPLQNVPPLDGNVILDVLDNGLEKLEKFNNVINNPLLPRTNILDQDFLIALNDGLVHNLANAINNIEGERNLAGGVLEAAGNPSLFNVVNNAVELQNFVPPHVATTLALVIPFAIGIFNSSLSQELRHMFTQRLLTINLDKIQWKPDITSMLNSKTYMFKDVQVTDLRIRGFSVEDLRVDGILYNNFENELQFPRFDISHIDFEALTMCNISFKNLKFDTITFDKLSFDVQTFWLYLSQTEYYLAFKDLGYKEVLAILTLGLVISALSSHISSFGVYPSPFYGNGCRPLAEVQRRHGFEYISLLTEYTTLEAVKVDLELPLTQEDSDRLELISRRQAYERGSLLNIYLQEEITSMENTVERLTEELRAFRHWNRPLQVIELQIEKIEQLQERIGEYQAAEQRLRRQRR